MTNRKNYNSIVFLTTLSVYLGLVLVGTPPILAQAALTQKIEIQNEAEIKDDLDKKPDEDLFASSLADLVSELNKFSEQGIFDWNRKSGYHKFDLISLSFESKTLEIKAEFESGNGKHAQVFADGITNYLDGIVSNSIATKEKIVAENTKITFENNQILIITHLPRASIDELLAKKDAQ